MSCIIDEKLVRWSKEGPRDFFHEDRNRFAFFSTFLTEISEKVSECIRSRKRPTSGYFSFNFKGRKMQFSA